MLRLFFVASAAIWLPYGLYCFFAPNSLASIAGIAANSSTGEIELRAMYGGLQTALGVLSAAAVFRPALERPALVTLSFLCAGLFMARLLGALLGAELSAYTAVGLLFELLSSVFATRLLARRTGRGPTEKPLGWEAVRE